MKNDKDLSTEAKRIFQQPYSRVFKAAEEGGFTAEVLELPGCFAEGETCEEASRNLEETALTWIEECLAKGEAVPAPHEESEHSGKVALRLSKSQHGKAVACAEKDGVSLNQFLVAAVAEALGEKKASRQNVTKIILHIRRQTTAGNTNADPLMALSASTAKTYVLQ